MTDWRNRIVRYGEMPAHEFLANPSNPRRHPASQREALRGSFDTLGIIAPILVNARTQFVIDGHARVEECLSRDENIMIPFIEVDLSEEEEALALASFDWITQMATYDADTLEALLQEVTTDNEALQALLDDMATQNGIDLLEETPLEDAGPQIDKGAELAERYGTQLGQIWQLGPHRLAIGDSTDRGVIEALMQGKKADMVFSDPPYGYEYQSNMRVKTKQFDVIANDNMILSGFIPRLSECSTGWVLICTSWKVIGEWLMASRPLGEMQNLIVWDKGGGGMGDLTHSLSTDYELIMAFNRGATIKGKRNGSVWSIGKDAAMSYEHPTQKPVALVVEAINTFSEKGNSIYDPFLGSGTTLIAAHQTGRICYGCEISPEYAAVVIQRWETLTGQTARLDTSTHEIPF